MFITRFLISFYKYKRKSSCSRNYTTKKECKDVKVLFFGSDNFSLPSLKALHKHNSENQNIGVVTSFKSPANCVRVYADSNKLPLYKWPITCEVCRPFDLGVVVSFGHLIPTHIIESFPLGMINVHASLLPRWRGAAPIIYAIMNGDTETGVSIMRIEPKRFDIGDILAQKSVTIKSGVYMPELHKELAEQGANLLLDVINDYPQSFQNPLKQIEEEATYAPKVTSDITEIDWNNMTAKDIYNRHRALHTFKILTSKFHSKSIELLDIMLPTTSINKFSSVSPAGSIEYCKERKCLQVKCANDTIIEVLKIRVEGKKAMNAIDFNNGFLKKLRKQEIKFQSNKKIIHC